MSQDRKMFKRLAMILVYCMIVIAMLPGCSRGELHDPNPEGGETVVVDEFAFATPNKTLVILLHDVDADNDLDILVGNAGSTNQVYLNNGTLEPFAGVQPKALTDSVNFTVDLILVDIDSDGDLDGIEANLGTNSVFLNEGAGGILEWSLGTDLLPDTLPTYTVVTADINQDGRIDVFLGNSQGNLNHLLLNTGHPPYFDSKSLQHLTDDRYTTEDMRLVDVDSDGDLDLVTANAGETNRLYLNEGQSPYFVRGTDLSEEIAHTFALAIGDVDNDGDPDIVSGNFGLNTLYLNTPTKENPVKFDSLAICNPDGITRSLKLGYIDDDDKLDLVVGNEKGPNRVFWNVGPPNFYALDSVTEFDPRHDSTRVIALGDLDGNDRVDIVVGNTDDRTNRIFFNITK